MADTPGWEASDLELAREGPSYTSDTLTTLAGEGLTPLQIFFITGADAFAEIATWHRYPQVLDLAHFVVVARPGARLSALAERLPDLAPRMIGASAAAQCALVRRSSRGRKYAGCLRNGDQATSGGSASIEGLVHPAVAAYIDRHALYRTARDSRSSTAPDAHGASGDTPGV